MKFALLFPVLIAAGVLALLASGYFAYGYDWEVFGFPLGLGVVCVALAAFSLRAEFTAARAESSPGAKKDLMDESEGLLENPQTWVQLGWFILLAAGSYLLGFILGPALLIAAYFRFDGRGTLVSLAAGALSAAAVWVIFVKIFQTPLPLQPIFMR